ncbi:hypothetical protein ACFVW8_32245 [Streptomyces sp. NPDC058221]|uniref:hypothetical protein n=1 Tax=Streptomyces sp. NPDC058221 TaxID=3346388 RepID=UPI0036E09B15
MSAAPEPALPVRLLGIPLTWPPGPADGCDVIERNLRLDPHWPVFAEHLPGNPMLPGSAIVHLMSELAQQLAGAARYDAVHTGVLRDVRFARALVPPARVRFTARRAQRPDERIECTAVLEEPTGDVVAARGVFITDEQ